MHDRRGLGQSKAGLVVIGDNQVDAEFAGPGGFAGVVSNPRHAEALTRAREALGRARAAAEDGAPGEIVSLELHETLEAIGEVTGEAVDEDLLERIFSRFCIGK